ncbi:MAG: indole-3-glycerol phosphate synthase TrpC [Candidatus Auribacterota bacterium]|nr:indole-3-glycerol phosphate synthase TrpC [Candidatus Auribacterota bacterium]
MILDKIVLQTREDLAKKQLVITHRDLDKQLEDYEITQRDKLFFNSVSRNAGGYLKVIAEVKKASPSKGVIRENFDFMKIAEVYDGLPVDAISVLTEEKFFMGSLDYLEKISGIVKKPLLRKDFIIDSYQIKEAALKGASAVLLIAAILDIKQLKDFMKLCGLLNLGYILEVHNMDELRKALQCDPVVVGINNRDLKSFAVDIHTTEILKKCIPDSITVVSESGINNNEHVLYLNELGVDAVLIGEALMKHDDIACAFGNIFGGIKQR